MREAGTRPLRRLRGERRGEAERNLLRQRAGEADLRVARGAQVGVALGRAVVGGRGVGRALHDLGAAVDLGQRVVRVAGHRRRRGDADLRIDGRRLRAGRDFHREAVLRRRRLAGAVEVGDQVLAEIVADAGRDRRDLDGAQVLDEPGMRRFAVERLKAAGEARGETERRGDGGNPRPRH